MRKENNDKNCQSVKHEKQTIRGINNNDLTFLV